MKMVSVFALAMWGVALGCQLSHAGTIVYSYDEQQRLTGANISRSASQSGPGGNQATVTYDYDKADNLTGYTVLTDSQYFKPFLLYFTFLRDDSARPKCYRES